MQKYDIEMHLGKTPFIFSCCFQSVREKLRKYQSIPETDITDKTDPIRISVNREDIRIIHDCYGPGSWCPKTEYDMLGVLASETLIPGNQVLFHSAAFLWMKKAWLLSGESGVGKTTQLRHWMHLYGQEMKVINGDKPLLIVPEKGDIWVYPSPWNGKEGFGNPLKAPLGGIICLEQGGLNQFHQLDAGEAVTPLLGQFISMMRTEEQIRKICQMEEQMIQRVPVYRMVNRGDECSAAQLHDFLQSELENMR